MSKPTGKLIRITPASIGAVPVGRKVNNKPLSGDISLNAGDVGAYSKTETDARVADAKTAGTNAQNTANSAKTAADKAQTSANTANNNANGRVPSGRKVNGKPLSADISLNAGDVGAFAKAETYNRTEIDNKVGAGSGLGVGQTWNDYKSQRAVNTVYTNSTGKPIMLSINFDGSSQHRRYELYINNLKVYNYFHAATTTLPVVSSVIPNGATYKLVVTGGTPITSWFELR